MKTTEEKIAVMQAYVDGTPLECRPNKNSGWVPIAECLPDSPIWDWDSCDYRVKDERTLERKIEDKWPDKKVVMFGWSSANIWGWTTGNKTEHIKAQSMRGFHTYVYQRPQDDSLFPDTKAAYCWNEGTTLQPVAVLFEGEG